MNNEMDPFASVRMNLSNSGNAPTSSSETEVASKSENDPFEEVRIKEVSGFPGISEIGRHATRVASRVAETVGGIPGDLNSFVQSGVLAGLEKLTGKPISKEVGDLIKGSNFPTSEELQQKSEYLTGGYTKAQSDKEKSGDEYVKTAASLLGPFKFRSALGIAAGSQLAKEGFKLLGLSEGPQEAAKIGTMLLLSFWNPRGAMKYASSQFKKAESLAKGASINASGLESGIKTFLDKLSKGVETPGKSAVTKPAEQILSKIKNGKISVEELTAAKRDINTLMGDPNLLKRERKLFKYLSEQVDKTIGIYEKINPAFSKAYRPANQIFGTVMQGQKASNFISKTLGSKSVIGATLAEAALGHPEFIIPTLATAGGIATAAKSIDFLSRLAKSPELRKFYTKALLGAVAQDSVALIKSEKKIEEILNKN